MLGIRLIYLMDWTPVGTLYAVAAGTGKGASERIHHFDRLPQQHLYSNDLHKATMNFTSAVIEASKESCQAHGRLHRVHRLERRRCFGLPHRRNH